MDVDEVMEVGEEHFPAVASAYSKVTYFVETTQADAASGLGGSGFFDTWVMYNDQLRMFLETSEAHLKDCGDTLVEIAKDVENVDEAMALSIKHTYEGSLSEALDAD